MSYVGLGPVQKAVYTRLSSDANLMSRVTEVTDTVRKLFPYIYLGSKTEVPFNVFDRIGHENTITIHVYTQDKDVGSAGNKLGESILEDVATLLCSSALSIEEHDAVLCELEYADTLVDEDGVTRNTFGRFRIISQDT